MNFFRFHHRGGGAFWHQFSTKTETNWRKFAAYSSEYSGSDRDEFIRLRPRHENVDGGDGNDLLVLRGSRDDFLFQSEGDGVRLTREDDPDYSVLVQNVEAVIFVPTGKLRRNVLKSLVPVAMSALVAAGDAVAEPGEANSAPVAVGDSGFTLLAGETIEIPVGALLANDSDEDGDELTVTGVDGAANGSVVLDGDTIRFTAEESGGASFRYTISDGTASASANVALQAGSAGPPPKAGPDYTIPEEALVTPDIAFGVANPSVAGGLDGNVYYSSSLPFINILKSAAGWSVRLSDGTELRPDALLAAGFLDENGYIKEMPDDAVNVEIVVHVPTASDGHVPTGRYVITYEGDAEIRPWKGGGTIVSQEPGRVVFDYTGPHPFIINMSTVDAGGNGDYLRNVSIVREDLVDLYEAGAVFDPGFIDLIEDHRVLRFMDMQSTNWSKQVDFEDIMTLDHYSWGGGASSEMFGVPISVMVDLANQVGADPWFCIPHQATDDYIRQFAEYVRDHLDPKLTAYFEYSNEVWNFIFEQAKWANATGIEVFKDVPEFQNDDYPFSEYYGYRSAEMMKIVQDVYGSDFDQRTHGVLATQTVNTGVLKQVMAGVEYYMDTTGHTVDELFDSIAVTGYFDAAIGSEQTLPLTRQWIEMSKARYEAGLEPTKYQYFIEQAAINLHDQSLQMQAYEDGLVTSKHGVSIEDLIKIYFPENLAIADSYGLDLIQYEGGSHVNVQGKAADDPEVLDFIIHLNDSPEMAQVTLDMIAAFREAGGTLVNDFVLIGSHKKSGSWGTLEYVGDESPIWDAWAGYNASTPGDWEERVADTFLHGDVFQGTDADDVLLGTVKQDFLLGGAGDDVLRGGLGDDGYNGGAGNDVVVLAGSASDYSVHAQGDGYVVEGEDGLDYLVNVEALYFTADGTFYDLG